MYKNKFTENLIIIISEEMWKNNIYEDIYLLKDLYKDEEIVI